MIQTEVRDTKRSLACILRIPRDPRDTKRSLGYHPCYEWSFLVVAFISVSVIVLLVILCRFLLQILNCTVYLILSSYYLFNLSRAMTFLVTTRPRLGLALTEYRCSVLMPFPAHIFCVHIQVHLTSLITSCSRCCLLEISRYICSRPQILGVPLYPPILIFLFFL